MNRSGQKVESFDAVVIGSGAGGSVAFSELVERQVGRVLLVEEGPPANSIGQKASVFEGIQRLYRDGGLRPILSNVGIIPFGEGRVLGGGTQVNGGLFWQTPSGVLQKWSADGSFLEGTALTENIKLYEGDLNVTEESEVDGYDEDSRIFAEAAARLGHEAVVARRATSGCSRSNLCAVGCPSGAKNSTTENLLTEAARKGGEVWTSTRAVKFKRSRSGLWDCHLEKENGEISVIETRSIYLAAGPFETPALISRSSPLGSGLFPVALHLNAKLIARFPHEVDADKATIFTRQVQDYTGRALLMATAYGEGYTALSASSIDYQHVRKMLRNPRNYAAYTVQIAPENFGRIVHLPGMAIRTYMLDKLTLSNLKRNIILMATLLFEAGAKELILPVRRGRAVSSLEALEEILAQTQRRHWRLSSVHAMSSVPLPATSRRRKSRISSTGELRKFPNVWVCCASAVPSHTIESPQATIMGLAKWIVGKSIDSDYSRN